MKKVKRLLNCSIVLLFSILFVTYTKQTFAVYDPLSVPNNKIGIHILFADEIILAKDLVNSNGGQWGYVTIPIQAGDRDLKKWQWFMDEAKKHYVIPIIRLATAGDYFKKTTWSKPEDSDILDFANFLNSLDWPVKNRYIIVFNEVNRGDEWEGKADPVDYSKLLSYAVTIFKSKSEDFFIISAGMDNAAASDGINFSEYEYFTLMDQAVPGIFNQIDGFSSHSYPNPGFSQPPNVLTPKSISSFLFEKQEVGALTAKNLPVFITETGWDQTLFSEKEVGDFFKTALSETWDDSSIVALTPFLLKGGGGPFEKFTFIKEGGEKNEIFKTFEGLPKIKGTPKLYEEKVLGTSEKTPKQQIPIKDFSESKNSDKGKKIKTFIRWLFLGL